jgi:cytidine deaminase
LTNELIFDQNYQKVLEIAMNAKATPAQSNYHVRSGAMTKSGRFFHAGNHEYSITRSMHGEETLVANVLEAVGPNDPIVSLGFVGHDEGGIAAPCGNCRDILRQYISPEAVVLYGSEEGGKATVMPFSRYIVEDFIEIKGARGSLSILASEFKSHSIIFAVQDALKKADASWDIYTSKDQVYGASLEFKRSNDTFSRVSAGLETTVAYHPTLPIQGVVSALDFTEDKWPSEIGRLFLISRHGMPQVPYLDRQALQELSDRINSLRDESQPIPIWLFHMNDENNIQAAWVTDSDEWYPYPFSAAKLLGKDDLRCRMKEILDK